MLFNAKSSPHGKTKRQNRRAAHMERQRAPPKGREAKNGSRGIDIRTLLGRTVVLCDYVASYSAALAKDTIFAFLFNFKDYVLNTNYSMGVKKYEDNDADDQITKGIMLVDGKVVDKNSLVVVKKIEAV